MVTWECITILLPSTLLHFSCLLFRQQPSRADPCTLNSSPPFDMCAALWATILRKSPVNSSQWQNIVPQCDWKLLYKCREWLEDNVTVISIKTYLWVFQCTRVSDSSNICSEPRNHPGSSTTAICSEPGNHPWSLFNWAAINQHQWKSRMDL